MAGTTIGIEVGQVWEGRIPRRDGSRERLTVQVNGRAALCRSANPAKGKAEVRSVGIMVNERGGSPLLGNLRLVATAEGLSVRFGADGVLELGGPC
jgi:hypothetical protein